MTASGFKMYKKAARDAQYELIERYAPLVKRIAYHLLARLPASVQVEDLIQAGMIGLLEVSTKYDASKGASLKRTPASASAAPCSMKCARGLGAAFGSPQHAHGQRRNSLD
jgi:hypothetical protein